MFASRWQFGVDEPRHLVLALYVRDAAGLDPVTDPVIPPLRPEVPVQPGLVSDADRAAVTTQWEHWWQHLWTAAEGMPHTLPRMPDQAPSLGGQGELQGTVQALFREATEFCSAHKRAVVEIEGRDTRRPDQTPEFSVLARATRRRGLRRAHPIDLHVSVLPTVAEQGWRPQPGHIVVTLPLRRNVPAYQRWLRPIAEELAHGSEGAPVRQP